MGLSTITVYFTHTSHIKPIHSKHISPAFILQPSSSPFFPFITVRASLHMSRFLLLLLHHNKLEISHMTFEGFKQWHRGETLNKWVHFEEEMGRCRDKGCVGWNKDWWCVWFCQVNVYSSKRGKLAFHKFCSHSSFQMFSFSFIKSIFCHYLHLPGSWKHLAGVCMHACVCVKVLL